MTIFSILSVRVIICLCCSYMFLFILSFLRNSHGNNMNITHLRFFVLLSGPADGLSWRLRGADRRRCCQGLASGGAGKV